MTRIKKRQRSTSFISHAFIQRLRGNSASTAVMCHIEKKSRVFCSITPIFAFGQYAYSVYFIIVLWSNNSIKLQHLLGLPHFTWHRSLVPHIYTIIICYDTRSCVCVSLCHSSCVFVLEIIYSLSYASVILLSVGSRTVARFIQVVVTSTLYQRNICDIFELFIKSNYANSWRS